MQDRRKALAVLTLLSLSVFILLVGPRLLAHGMFFDGVTYASISRNLAEGVGSVWRPHYTAVIYPEFHEQPPLFFVLQSLAFRLVGDSPHVEALWSFGMGLLVLLLTRILWVNDRTGTGSTSGAWVPVLLFVAIPLTAWVYSNNMLEGTMAVFTTAAVFVALRALGATSQLRAMILAVCAGVLTLAAVLVKGPVGLFPLGVPFLWCVALDRRGVRRAALATLFMFASMAVALLLLLVADQDALPSLKAYYLQQVVAGLSGARERTGSHFNILGVIVREALVPLVVGGVAWVSVRLAGIHDARPEPGRRFWLYLLIGLSASVPVTLSAKQMSWYVFPSFPFYGLGFAALFQRSFRAIEDACARTARRRVIIGAVACALLVGALVGMLRARGTVLRQKDLYHDLILPRASIPEREVLSVYPPGLEQDWALVASMQRQFKASLSDSLGHRYLLSTVDQQPFIEGLHRYQRVHPADPMRYQLWGERPSPPR